MKKSTSLIALGLCIAIPALIASFFASEANSAVIFFGSYTIAGLLYITAADYSPHRVYSSKQSTCSPHVTWTRLALSRSARPIRTLQAGKASTC